MRQEQTIASARTIMMEFARDTGLFPATGSPRRYLWTDAFAVCNFLGLYRETGEKRFKEMALQLVDQVHGTLGKYRPDDRRTGWLSGLNDEEGKLHPTSGGLRIGKNLAERRPDENVDERLEWDRDGQYYHYLTKWMHALDCVTRVTGDFLYNRWALELAKKAHATFVYVPSHRAGKRMYWKMSTDLMYPLVPSMGLHDPLDGLVTYAQLQATAAGDRDVSKPDLRDEIADMAAMCHGKNWATDDPLGIGGLLSDAYRAAQLVAKDAFPDATLPGLLLAASLSGLEAFSLEDVPRLPAGARLAFRELGLSIGLKAAQRLSLFIDENQATLSKQRELKRMLESLKTHEPLAQSIEDFWMIPGHQRQRSWTEHLDINMVMLATSLAPDGYLTLYAGSRR